MTALIAIEAFAIVLFAPLWLVGCCAAAVAPVPKLARRKPKANEIDVVAVSSPPQDSLLKGFENV